MGSELTNGRGPQIGQLCPRKQCSGVLGVGRTKVDLVNRVRVRYLYCKKCGTAPIENKQIVPLRFAPPQVSRQVIARKK